MEIVKEILLIALQAVIIAVIPACAKHFINWVLQEKKARKEESDSEHVDAIIDRVGKLVVDVVTETTQTYVDALKKENKFDVEKQKQAFNMSYTKLKTMLNEEYKDVIESVFGNLEEYLTTKIEAAVATNKTWQQ